MPSDHLSAEAVVSAIQVFGWKQYAVLHTNNQYARSYELELQTFTQGGTQAATTPHACHHPLTLACSLWLTRPSSL